MSYDLYVWVKREQWPTAWALNDAIRKQGFPVEMAEREGQLWNEPLAPVIRHHPITIRDARQAAFFGAEIGSEVQMPIAEAMPLRFAGHDIQPDWGFELIDDLDRANGLLRMVKGNYKADVGDHFAYFSHHSSAWHWNASVYVLATLVREFGGVGVDPQGSFGGRENFVEELMGSLITELGDVPDV